MKKNENVIEFQFSLNNNFNQNFLFNYNGLKTIICDNILKKQFLKINIDVKIKFLISRKKKTHSILFYLLKELIYIIYFLNYIQK